VKEIVEHQQYVFDSFWSRAIPAKRGIGIHPEVLSRLFQKFATKSYQGTGLGLYISKSIVEAHGGKMWAENNPDGKGCTFYFTLPIV
jgi:signal transduction histidine kinase